MAVLAEMYSVIFRNSGIEAQYPGGLDGYRSACPNSTFCSDGEVCRIGFMALTDAETFLDSLKAVGIRKDSGDLALTDQNHGLLQPCDWLALGRMDVIPTAALIGSQLQVLVAPPGWSPSRGKAKYLTEEDLQRDYEFVGAEEGTETYRNRATGELVYVGRVQPPKT